MNTMLDPSGWFFGKRQPKVVIVLCLTLSFGYLIPTLRAYATSAISPTTGAGNLGTNIAPSGNVYGIRGGQTLGNSLFHSFEQFSVGTGDIAQFQSPGLIPNAAMSNILGRVTGANPSSIFGTIDSASYYPSANLFLMNPHGILFGPNASLNVGGSVTFTTANYLRLADSGIFHADPAVTSVLTSAPVASFGFLGSDPSAITVQGSQLSVADGMSISLIGGNVTIQSGTPDGGTAQPAQLSAPNGKIQLASAASPGEFDAATLQALPNIDGTSFASFGSVTLAPGSNINVSGTNSFSIVGGQFVLSVNDVALSTAESTGPAESISLSAGSSITSLNSSSHPGADIQIKAENLQLDGASIQNVNTGDGAGGNIAITGQSVSLTNGAQIVSSTSGAGTGGNISLESTDFLNIAGFDPEGTLSGVLTEGIVRSGIFSTSSSTGNGGDIIVSSQTLTLEQLGTIASATLNDGSGGDISISGSTLRIVESGEIRSETGMLDLESGEFIGGIGQGGAISVITDESVLISGLSGFSRSGITSTAFAAGDGGSITVVSPAISIENAAQIRSVSVGEGASGAITLQAADSLTVQGFQELVIPFIPFPIRLQSSVVSEAQSTGNSGTITVTGGAITLAEEGRIQTVTAGDGKAGDLTVKGSTIELSGGGFIESLGAGTGTTGAVNVTASETLTIRGLEEFDPLNQSRISNVQMAEAENGGLSIHALDVLLTEGGRIRNDSVVNGSPTSITADNSIKIESGGRIASRADIGVIGPVELRAPTITLDQGSVTTRTITEATGGAITLEGRVITLTNGSELASAPEEGTGAGGPITVIASDSVSVSGSSMIQSISFADGPAGAINLSAVNSITITGSGTAVSSETIGSGPGGAITVQSAQVNVSDGAVISAKSTGSGAAGSVTIQGNSPAQSVLISGPDSGIFTSTEGTGAGGNIFINANTVTIQNGGTLSAKSSGTETPASGGSITINALDQVSMTGGASVTAESAGPGDAGNIFINAGRQLEMHDSSIKTEAAQASGGNIDIQAVDRVSLVNSTISTSVLGGSGSGGNITIDPTLISLANSNILAQAILGSGGNIRLVAGLLLVDPTSLISASSEFGQSGTIQSPTSNLAGTVGSLPSSVRQGQTLQAQRCASVTGGESSSFIIAGRDQVPTEPGGWMVSSIAVPATGEGEGLSGLSSLSSSSGSFGLFGAVRPKNELNQTNQKNQVNQIDQIDQTDEPPILSLRRLTPAGFLTQHFAEGETSGCRS